MKLIPIFETLYLLLIRVSYQFNNLQYAIQSPILQYYYDKQNNDNYYRTNNQLFSPDSLHHMRHPLPYVIPYLVPYFYMTAVEPNVYFPRKNNSETNKQPDDLTTTETTKTDSTKTDSTKTETTTTIRPTFSTIPYFIRASDKENYFHNNFKYLTFKPDSSKAFKCSFGRCLPRKRNLDETLYKRLKTEGRRKIQYPSDRKYTRPINNLLSNLLPIPEDFALDLISQIKRQSQKQRRLAT